MYLKHYTAVPQSVLDPMRPGRTAKVMRLVDSGITSHSDGGRTYEADANGWFDFPQDVAERLRTFRDRGSGWFGQSEVADQVRLGGMDEMDRPAVGVDEPKRSPRRPRNADVE